MGSALSQLKPDGFHAASYVPLYIICTLGFFFGGTLLVYSLYKGERQDVTCTIAGEPTVEVKDVSSCCYEEHCGKHFSLMAIALVLAFLLYIKSLLYYVYVKERVAKCNPDLGQYWFTVFQSYMAQLLARIVMLVITPFFQLAKFRPTEFRCASCTPQSKGNTTSGPLQEYDCKIPDLFPSKVTAGWFLFFVNLGVLVVSGLETCYLLYRNDKYRNDEYFFHDHLHIKVKESEGLRAPLLGEDEAQPCAPAGESITINIDGHSAIPVDGTNLPAPSVDKVTRGTAENVNRFKEYLTSMQLPITDVSVSSLHITVMCTSLEILEDLWQNYTSGALNDAAQRCLVTDEVLKKYNLKQFKLVTTIDEEEYISCKSQFIEKQALRNVSELTGDVWQLLGRRLGLDEEILREIAVDRGSSEEKAFAMLMAWKKRRTATNLLPLMRALREIGREDLAEDLEEFGEIHEALRNVSKSIRDKWQLVGELLDLDDEILREIEVDRGSSEEKAFAMLMAWKSRRPEIDLLPLMRALREIGRKDVADNLEEHTETQEALRKVSKSIRDEWQLVGRRLGLDDKILREIAVESSSSKEKAFAMLMAWKKRRTATDLLPLMRALREIGREDLADNLEEFGETREALRNVSKSIQHEWQLVGKLLDLDNEILQKIAVKSSSSKEKAFAMLMAWKKRRTVADLLPLMRVLRKIGREDVAHNLEDLMFKYMR